MAARMPTTMTTESSEMVPRRACRPAKARPISRHWPTAYSRMHTRPAHASQRDHCCHPGFEKKTATAASTSAVPSHPTMSNTRFSMRYPRHRSLSTAFAVRNRPKVMKLR